VLDDSAASAAGGVLRRLLGERANEFSLTSLPATDGLDAFEVEAHEGLARIRGTSAVAISRGAYEYLREACHAQVSWSAHAVTLPPKLPSYDSRRVSCKNRLRCYLSVCTFGYSAPWWDWKRWEQEIDWMALHGLNMPLALGGQELVWQRVFRQLGVGEKDIRAHFSGPAYLPWHRLGNLNGHLGPLPQSWIDSQAVLQRLILDRERELGMIPVVPGFSGFVPTGFGKVRPGAELHDATAWAGFPQTTFVDPRDPIFREIGSLFIREYRREFGPAHHYLCETFAEQNPPFGAETVLDDLRAIGLAAWETLSLADPEAHWVIQGWPFYYAREYWTPDRTAALFDSVPDGRLIVLDQATEELEVWREQPTIREKGWIFGVVHNYGQNTHLHGDLQGLADRAQAAITDAEHGNMLGMGIMPEGIDQNPIVYELLTDIMWSAERIDVSSWIKGYARSRYGSCPEGVAQAWRLLQESVYGSPGSPTLRLSWRSRPGDQPILPRFDVAKVGEAARCLESAAKTLGSNPLFRRDLVDVAKTWLGGLADAALHAALTSNVQVNEDQTRFLGILRDLDRLMAALPEHRLSTWLASARSMATNSRDADLFERNARMLVTVWGGPFLFDYAAREWAGLIKDFQLPRWERFFEAARNGSSLPDFGGWETRWACSTRAPVESLPEDALAVCTELLNKYESFSRFATWESPGLPLPFGPLQLRVLDIGDHGSAPPEGFQLDLGEIELVCGVAAFPVFGQGCRARYSAELSEDGIRWHGTGGVGRSTFRGTRQTFEPTPARFVRVSVQLELGDESQLFRALVFKPG